MSVIHWSRIDAVHFGRGLDDTRRIGFDDAHRYEDFRRPLGQRPIRVEQAHREIGARGGLRHMDEQGGPASALRTAGPGVHTAGVHGDRPRRCAP